MPEEADQYGAPSGRPLYRAMALSEDGQPVVGPGDLGVRPNDLQPDEQGLAQPLQGGMSVTPDDPMLMPIFRRPPSLYGTSKRPVWEMPDSEVTKPLALRFDSPTHGLVEPWTSVPFEEYLDDLESTRPSWTLRHE